MGDQIRTLDEEAREFVQTVRRFAVGRAALRYLWGGIPDDQELAELSDITVQAIARGVRFWIARHYHALQPPGGELRAPASGAYMITRYADGHETITCATCGAMSANPHDVREKYCGHCERFHEEV
jgi:hypothetical protein